MYTIYKVITRSGHTYIGLTTDIHKRSYDHRYDISKGRLGGHKIPKTFEVMIEVIAEARYESDARMLESRHIAFDMLDNLKNCNKHIGRTNTF